MNTNKKEAQLGMKPQTASQRLARDLLWYYAASRVPCFHCGKPMTREDFTVEHKIPWLDSDDPVGLFFDVNNISFSHGSCNKGARRSREKKVTPEERKKYQADYYQKNKEKWRYRPERAEYMRQYRKKRRTEA